MPRPKKQEKEELQELLQEAEEKFQKAKDYFDACMQMPEVKKRRDLEVQILCSSEKLIKESLEEFLNTGMIRPMIQN